MIGDLQLVPLKDIIEEIERRHKAYVLVVSENPDDPERNLVWWNGKVYEVNWMIDQAKAELHSDFPPSDHEDFGHGSKHV